MRDVGKEVFGYKFEDLEHISNILSYEGPLLSHYKKGDDNYLFLWVDTDSSYNRWMVFECDDKSLLEYLSGDIGLGVVFSKRSGSTYLLDVNGKCEYDRVCQISDEEVGDYIEAEDATYKLAFPEEYEYLRK